MSKGRQIVNFKQGVAPYLELEEDGSVIPHIALTSLDTSQCDSSLTMGSASAELVSSSGSACRAFCIKRRLSVPLLIVEVMTRGEVRVHHKAALNVLVADDTQDQST